MANYRIEDLMYHSGLTAQGCWDAMDDYDHQAIEKLIELVVKDCASIVENEGRFLKYDRLANKIRDTFSNE